MNNRTRPVTPPARIVVVGIGNFLLGDDGLGVHALWKLRETLPDPRIEYLDGGTVGLGLLPYLEEATHVLFLDAIDAPEGLRAGDGLIELPLEGAAADLGLRVSPHDAGLPDLIGTLRLRRGDRPLTLRLLGAPPSELGVSTELSESAERALVRVVGQAVTLLRKWLDQNLGKAA